MRILPITVVMTIGTIFATQAQGYKMVDEKYDAPFGEWYVVEGDKDFEGMFYMDDSDNAIKETLRDLLGDITYNKPTASGFITDEVYYREWDNVMVEGRKANVSYVKNLTSATIGLEYLDEGN